VQTDAGTCSHNKKDGGTPFPRIPSGKVIDFMIKKSLIHKKTLDHKYVTDLAVYKKIGVVEQAGVSNIIYLLVSDQMDHRTHKQRHDYSFTP